MISYNHIETVTMTAYIVYNSEQNLRCTASILNLVLIGRRNILWRPKLTTAYCDFIRNKQRILSVASSGPQSKITHVWWIQMVHMTNSFILIPVKNTITAPIKGCFHLIHWPHCLNWVITQKLLLIRQKIEKNEPLKWVSNGLYKLYYFFNIEDSFLTAFHTRGDLQRGNIILLWWWYY